MTGVAIQRAHAMPFGAEVRPNGTVVFRLWAPAARRVELRLVAERSASRTLALEASTEGWFESSVDDVPPGTLYSFQPDEKRWLPEGGFGGFGRLAPNQRLQLGQPLRSVGRKTPGSS